VTRDAQQVLKGIHIKDAFLSHRNKLWRAEIRFKRLNEKQISQVIWLALAVAKGYIETDDGEIVDECLFDVIFNLASEFGLKLDQYIPSKLIEKRLTEYPMSCHQLKQRFEAHGVNKAIPIHGQGPIEDLGKRPNAFYLSLVKINMTKSAPSVDGLLIVKPWDSRSAWHCVQVGEPYLHDGGTSIPALA